MLSWLRERLTRPRRTGFWYRTHKGNVAHIQGDRHMSRKTLAALEAMIDAACKAVEDGTIGKREG